MKRRQQGNISDYFKPQKERTEGTSDNKIPKDTSTNDADDAETIAQIAENTENTEAIKIAEKPNQHLQPFLFQKLILVSNNDLVKQNGFQNTSGLITTKIGTV